MEEARRRGYHVTEEDIFKENGYSGALGIDERPVLHQLWEKYQAGEYDAIFVYRQDRLSRSLALFAALRDEARKVRRCGLRGDGFIFLQGSNDDTPEGKLHSNILGAFAEYEREVIKLRTVTGKKKLAKAGKYAGGSQPLGYKWNDEKEKWEIVEEEAKIIKLIYQWYVYGDESGQPMGGFPQRVMTWEELLDRLQVKLWVYPDRLEVRGIVPIEDIANPKCCSSFRIRLNLDFAAFQQNKMQRST